MDHAGTLYRVGMKAATEDLAQLRRRGDRKTYLDDNPAIKQDLVKSRPRDDSNWRIVTSLRSHCRSYGSHQEPS